MTGSEGGFQGIRYWELRPSLDAILLRKVFLLIHMELLYGLHEILIDPDRPKETVEARVCWKVRKALWEHVDRGLILGSVNKLLVENYRQWLERSPSWSEALAKAVQRDFKFDNELTQSITREAYTSLLESRDPAVRYFASRMDVIPKQPRDAIPYVQWLEQEENTQGMVKTPGGTTLGRIDRGPDGVWHIAAFRTGPTAVPAIANSKTDALCHVATLMSRPAWVTTDGQRQELRIVGEERHQFQRTGDSSGNATAGKSTASRDSIYRVIFWNADHGLEISQFTTVEVPRMGNDDTPTGALFTDVVEGIVHDVHGAEVSIEGRVFTRIDKAQMENKEQ